MIRYTMHDNRNTYDMFHTSIVTSVKPIERSVNRADRKKKCDTDSYT